MKPAMPKPLRCASDPQLRMCPEHQEPFSELTRGEAARPTLLPVSPQWMVL